jgi:mRNA-degrading endonuclease RelE of RelBE toxin-antitoxin system
MWQIFEHRDVQKVCRRLPPSVLKKYQAWKEIVRVNGPDKLREFSGYHDEKLQGERFGERSSRLSLHYRVIYAVERSVVTIRVLEITPHEY